jgi:phosphatidylserine/phosphatidylglycerophosphate/cardiolipin synthase-like enzyme
MRLLTLYLTVMITAGHALIALGEDGRYGTDRAWSAYFSPTGGVTDAVVAELDKATASILVQAYAFSSKPIAQALIAASKRGVKVEVILDKNQESRKYSMAKLITAEGITPLIDGRHAIAHNKIMVIDGRTVITGSFNFTTAAEAKNAENLLVIHDPKLAEYYTVNWRNHAAHSLPSTNVTDAVKVVSGKTIVNGRSLANP